jgi:predicted glycosyltransferase
MNIWIDLWAAPDPLFFRPIIKRLHSQGHKTWITARIFGETTAIAKQCGFHFQVVGRHGGQTTLGKMAAILKGALQLTLMVRKENIDLAVSFNSYAQGLAARLCGIPYVTSMDYEFQPANHLAFRLAQKVIVPRGFDQRALRQQGATAKKVIFYDGLKENITLVDFNPDPAFPQILDGFDIALSDVLITMRPPATGAAYHRFENTFFEDALVYLAKRSDIKILLLPRSDSQARHFRALRLDNIVISPHVLDGLNLVYWSDMVISAGGSMNREAIVMGTPACTIFRGRMAGVDRKMIENGMLRNLESFEDLKQIIPIQKHRRQFEPICGTAIDQVIQGILSVRS